MQVNQSTPLHTMTEAQAAYVAGIIDGEGCIAAKGVTGRNQVEKVLYPFVTIQMKTAQPLITIVEWIGWKVYYTKDRGFTRLDLMGQRATQLLGQIRPYLILKADQADLALELATLTVGRGAGACPRKGIGGTRTPQVNLDRMRKIDQDLRALKRM